MKTPAFMKTTALHALFVCAALGVGSAAHADCTHPKAPDATPDGNTATKEEMLNAMSSLKEYNVKMNEYLECLDKEGESRVAAAGPNASKEQIAQIKSIQNQRHDSAVEELQMHAKSFNEQVQVFKARKSS